MKENVGKTLRTHYDVLVVPLKTSVLEQRSDLSGKKFRENKLITGEFLIWKANWLPTDTEINQ